MKSLIINFLACVILTNSLSWLVDGDFEAVINDHEIHEVTDSNNHLTSANVIDDHHCELSAHLCLAILNDHSTPFPNTLTQLSLDTGDNYLSAFLQQLKRPPISIS